MAQQDNTPDTESLLGPEVFGTTPNFDAPDVSDSLLGPEVFGGIGMPQEGGAETESLLGPEVFGDQIQSTSVPRQQEYTPIMEAAPYLGRQGTKDLYMLERMNLPEIGQDDPGILERTFDILSRPNFAVAGFVDALVNEDKNILEALGRGTKELIGGSLTGLERQKETFSDVLEDSGIGEGGSLAGLDQLIFGLDAEGKDTKGLFTETGEGAFNFKRDGILDFTGRGALGLLLDVGLDPTTYFGPLGFLKVGRTAKGGLGITRQGRGIAVTAKNSKGKVIGERLLTRQGDEVYDVASRKVRGVDEQTSTWFDEAADPKVSKAVEKEFGPIVDEAKRLDKVKDKLKVSMISGKYNKQIIFDVLDPGEIAKFEKAMKFKNKDVIAELKNKGRDYVQEMLDDLDALDNIKDVKQSKAFKTIVDKNIFDKPGTFFKERADLIDEMAGPRGAEFKRTSLDLTDPNIIDRFDKAVEPVIRDLATEEVMKQAGKKGKNLVFRPLSKELSEKVSDLGSQFVTQMAGSDSKILQTAAGTARHMAETAESFRKAFTFGVPEDPRFDRMVKQHSSETAYMMRVMKIRIQKVLGSTKGLSSTDLNKFNKALYQEGDVLRGYKTGELGRSMDALKTALRNRGIIRKTADGLDNVPVYFRGSAQEVDKGLRQIATELGITDDIISESTRFNRVYFPDEMVAAGKMPELIQAAKRAGLEVVTDTREIMERASIESIEQIQELSLFKKIKDGGFGIDSKAFDSKRTFKDMADRVRPSGRTPLFDSKVNKVLAEIEEGFERMAKTGDPFDLVTGKSGKKVGKGSTIKAVAGVADTTFDKLEPDVKREVIRRLLSNPAMSQTDALNRWSALLDVKNIENYLPAFKSSKVQGEFFDQATVRLGDDSLKVPTYVKEWFEKNAPGAVNDPGVGKALRMLDGMTNFFKGAVTAAAVPLPGKGVGKGALRLKALPLHLAFHTRNALSNLWLGYLNVGVQAFNPARNFRVLNIMKGGKGMIDIPGGRKLSYDRVRELAGMSKDAFSEAAEQGGAFKANIAGIENIFKFDEAARGGVNVVPDPTQLAELVGRDPATVKKSTPFANGWFGKNWKEAGVKGRDVGNTIELHGRLNLFLTHLESGKTAEQAAGLVDEFLFNYSHLSDFEKNFMRRVVPFYTFTRKNLPNQIKSLLTNPTKQVIPAKILRMDQEDAKVLPSWEAGGTTIVLDHGLKNIEVIRGVDLPIKQLSYLDAALGFIPGRSSDKRKDAWRDLVNMVHPYAKRAFIEDPSGVDVFTGRSIARKYNDAAGKFVEEAMPKGIQDWLGYKKTVNKYTGKETHSFDGAKYWAIVDSWFFSRFLGTADSLFDMWMKDANKKEMLAKWATGLKIEDLPKDEVLRSKFRERLRQLKSAAGQKGSASDFTISTPDKQKFLEDQRKRRMDQQ
jgi:hypothetical protein